MDRGYVMSVSAGSITNCGTHYRKPNIATNYICKSCRDIEDMTSTKLLCAYSKLSKTRELVDPADITIDQLTAFISQTHWIHENERD